MRSASRKLPAEMFPRIIALVMFGDRGIRDMSIPQFPKELEDKLFENCAKADPVCITVLSTSLAPSATSSTNRCRAVLALEVTRLRT